MANGDGLTFQGTFCVRTFPGDGKNWSNIAYQSQADIKIKRMLGQDALKLSPGSAGYTSGNNGQYVFGRYPSHVDGVAPSRPGSILAGYGSHFGDDWGAMVVINWLGSDVGGQSASTAGSFSSWNNWKCFVTFLNRTGSMNPVLGQFWPNTIAAIPGSQGMGMTIEQESTGKLIYPAVGIQN